MYCTKKTISFDLGWTKIDYWNKLPALKGQNERPFKRFGTSTGTRELAPTNKRSTDMLFFQASCKRELEPMLQLLRRMFSRSKRFVTT